MCTCVYCIILLLYNTLYYTCVYCNKYTCVCCIIHCNVYMCVLYNIVHCTVYMYNYTVEYTVLYCRFLLGHHKAALETYAEASLLSLNDWVSTTSVVCMCSTSGCACAMCMYVHGAVCLCTCMWVIMFYVSIHACAVCIHACVSDSSFCDVICTGGVAQPRGVFCLPQRLRQGMYSSTASNNYDV